MTIQVGGVNVISDTSIHSNSTWNANVISAEYGGTGQSSYSIGDILSASSSNTFTKIASVGVGNIFESGGVGAAPTWSKTSLTTDISGTLDVSQGGFSVSSLTAGAALVGNGTSQVRFVQPGSLGNILISDGTQWKSGAATVSSSVSIANNANSNLAVNSGFVVINGGPGFYKIPSAFTGTEEFLVTKSTNNTLYSSNPAYIRTFDDLDTIDLHNTSSNPAEIFKRPLSVATPRGIWSSMSARPISGLTEYSFSEGAYAFRGYLHLDSNRTLLVFNMTNSFNCGATIYDNSNKTFGPFFKFSTVAAGGAQVYPNILRTAFNDVANIAVLMFNNFGGGGNYGDLSPTVLKYSGNVITGNATTIITVANQYWSNENRNPIKVTNGVYIDTSLVYSSGTTQLSKVLVTDTPSVSASTIALPLNYTPEPSYNGNYRLLRISNTHVLAAYIRGNMSNVWVGTIFANTTHNEYTTPSPVPNSNVTVNAISGHLALADFGASHYLLSYAPAATNTNTTANLHVIFVPTSSNVASVGANVTRLTLNTISTITGPLVPDVFSGNTFVYSGVYAYNAGNILTTVYSTSNVGGSYQTMYAAVLRNNSNTVVVGNLVPIGKIGGSTNELRFVFDREKRSNIFISTSYVDSGQGRIWTTQVSTNNSNVETVLSLDRVGTPYNDYSIISSNTGLNFRAVNNTFYASTTSTIYSNAAASGKVLSLVAPTSTANGYIFFGTNTDVAPNKQYIVYGEIPPT